MYINTQTLEYPLTLRQVRQAVPNVSLPKKPGEATLNALGFATVQPTERPTGDVVTEGQPEKQTDGTWRQVWNTRPYTDAERAEALERAKSDAMQRINVGYEAEMGAILNAYPQAETLTWDKQEREARAWQADNTVATPYIDALAAGRSMDKAELATRIIAKADAWVSLSGAATGKRQAMEDEISAATSIDGLNAISW
ncbi:hypothetical protein [Herbaspirillum sp.]|jgi:hypothetical protein|uniref:hypothetical protein n=1 Tax=Herbaspirillum sp. TaxID=1890675 RepID=UPI000C0AFB9A|nr:hypothetical protein [Herbaspirillum sp.]MAF06172.1 hypothetical protein [Herbaspirillum sp.]|tara:strand:+ start:30468 stop:31061 length:594 start_codon:yes stop_codon:yes gene_type:complete